MKTNIDMLLGKMRPDTLAYELVSLLQEHEEAEWDEVLRRTVEERVRQEIRRLSHGQDQATGD